MIIGTHILSSGFPEKYNRNEKPKPCNFTPRPAHNDVVRDPLYYIPSTRFSASSNYITTCRVVRVFITSAERQPRGVGKNKQLLEHLLPKGLDSMVVHVIMAIILNVK